MPTISYSQGQSDNWYFGFGAGVHFNLDGTVDALSNGQLNTFEGCATISDSQGNLLFYTDGRTVYDRQHNIMVNGRNLFGQPSSTQSVIIVPKPESPNIYYIITRGLSKFIVDSYYTQIKKYKTERNKLINLQVQQKRKLN